MPGGQIVEPLAVERGEGLEEAFCRCDRIGWQCCEPCGKSDRLLIGGPGLAQIVGDTQAVRLDAIDRIRCPRQESRANRTDAGKQGLKTPRRQPAVWYFGKMPARVRSGNHDVARDCENEPTAK